MKRISYYYRYLLRRAAGLLPREKRFALFRNKIKLDLSPPANLILKVAETQEELEECFHLLHDAYVAADFMKPNPSGMRATVYHALPTTTTLLARYNRRIVGTISLIRESPLGFPMQKIFNIEKIRKQGGNIAEVSALAVERRFQALGGIILFPLLKFLYEYSTKYFDTRHLVIAVNPRHIGFYESILSFKRLEQLPVKHYDFVNGAPAVGAHLDLQFAPEIWAQNYAGQPPERNMHAYLCGSRLENIVFPDKRFYTTTDPVMTPELLDYFFNRRTQAFAKLTEEEKRLFWTIYDLPAYRRVLPVPQEISRLADTSSRPDVTQLGEKRQRQHQRFSVMCPAELTISTGGHAKTFSITVTECSLNGFRARSERGLPLEVDGTVNVNLGRADHSTLPVRVLRRAKNTANTYVFRVEAIDLPWRKFVVALRKAPTHGDLDYATRYLD